MKKLLFTVLFVLPFILAGCGDGSSENNSNTSVNENISFSLYDNNSYSVLKADDNSNILVTINNISQTAGDTVTVSFPNANPEDFTVTQSYLTDKYYGITVRSNLKTTSINTFNVSVKNKLGEEIFNKNVDIYTVHRTFPFYFSENQPIPYLDNHTFNFSPENPSNTILFRQLRTEYTYKIENGILSTDKGTMTIKIQAYGFNEQNLDNTPSYNNFTVDADSTELEYNGTMYPNCLNYRGSNDCAVKITNDNPSVESNAVFYMNIGPIHTGIALNLKNSVQ